MDNLLLKLTSFIAFYVGQQCSDHDNLPPSIYLIEALQGINGILDTFETLAEGLIELKGIEFFEDMGNGDDTDASIIYYIGDKLNLHKSTDK